MNRLKKSLVAALILLAIGEFAGSRADHGGRRDAGSAVDSSSGAAAAGFAAARPRGVVDSLFSRLQSE